MKVHDYIKEERIFVLGGCTDKRTFLRELAARVKDCCPLIDADRLYADLAGEHGQPSIDTSSGVAICHAITEGVDDTTCIVSLAPAGVRFNQDESVKIRVALLLISPAEKTGTHARILARILRLASSREFASRVNRAARAEELYSLIVQEDASHV